MGMSDATAVCEKLQVFADGELSLEEVPAFERHFAECTDCQAELQDLLLLESLAQGLQTPAVLPPLEHVPRFPARRSRRTALVLGALVGVSGLMVGALLARVTLGHRHPVPVLAR
jgi:anti-sigma factor RsiW